MLTRPKHSPHRLLALNANGMDDRVGASNMFLEFCTIEALNLRPGSKELEAFNVERVRGYLDCNLGCKKKKVIYALGLHPRTVAKAIKIIRAKADRSDRTLQS
jgi:hypothetical protein